jgi:DNA adenine methylase
LKWAGGKGQILAPLLARVPAHIGTYYEPFVGGGALFFALMAGAERRPNRVVLNDLNPDLITAYEAVRDRPDALTARLSELERRYLEAGAEGREAMYYEVRESKPRTAIGIAARLVFLNKTCFNGLYRVNRGGHFNVPHGRYRTPRIADRETLLAASGALAGVTLRNVDFEEACADAQSGDFVYFDPPFHPLSATSNFTQYTEGDFGRADQVRLKRCIDDLTRRGVGVLLSNSPHPWIRGGYEFAGYVVEQVSARRAINSRGDRRGPIGELMITNALGAEVGEGLGD